MRKFITTIIERSPHYIESYTLSEQLLLTEFIEILKACQEKAGFARKELSEQLTQYRIQKRESEEYLTTPFLWFSAIYYETASLLLSFTDFQASTFYDFLVTMLRGKEKLPGFFQLVRNQTLLKKLDWEQLQYACSRYRMPITNEQFSLLQKLYSYVNKAGIDGILYPKINNYIQEHLKTEKKTKDMIHLLKILDAKWQFWFHYPAFGLKKYHIQFLKSKSTSITDIIDIHDYKNTTLCNSRLFQLKEDPQSYTGYLVVPEDSSNKLHPYFELCKQNKEIIDFEIMEILDSRRSNSLFLYRYDKGWIGLSEKEKLDLSNSLKIKHPRKKRKKLADLFVTYPFNREWRYTHHSSPEKVISLLIKLSNSYYLENLPPRNIENLKVLDSDLALLTDLVNNHNFQASLIIDRLIHESSLDIYSIEIPIMAFKQLNLFLNVIPFAYLFYTESKIYIWAYLNPEEVNWIRTQLNWRINEILLEKSFLNLDREWFDFENLVWFQPKILNQ